MMLRAVGRRCSTGSATVLGDLAQATTPWATRSWGTALRHLGKPDAHVEQLTKGFRVPGEVIEYAARLLPVDRARPRAADVGAPDPRRARGPPGRPDRHRADRRGRRPRPRSHRVGSVGLIVPDRSLGPSWRCSTAGRRRARRCSARDRRLATAPVEFEVRLDVVPASLAKGLEFDHVVLVEPAAIVAGEADRVTGLRRLYVCLTRAVTSLVVLHGEDLPAELGHPDTPLVR